MAPTDPLAVETENLRLAWKKHKAEFLDAYLIQDVEDPRIQFQSILTRSFLLDTLFPMEFHDLVRSEFCFSVCVNSILDCCKTRRSPLTRRRLLQALQVGDSYLDLWKIPECLRETFQMLQGPDSVIPDYITPILEAELSQEERYLPMDELDVFMDIWSDKLADRSVGSEKLKVMEAACGSANDYQFWSRCGLGRLIDYHGFDLNEDNVVNARRKCPGVRFEVGSAMEIPVDDQSCDCFVVHDLFEHLSLEAMERVFTEIRRVTKNRACLSFFNMADIPEHIVEPVETYYWNTLSLDRIKAMLGGMAKEMQVIPIAGFIRQEFGVDRYYNPGACTLILSFH